MALFGEKYGDEVRVLAMGGHENGSFSIELCGGTHVARTGDIGIFVIVSESSVSSGVRRIEAVTGELAADYLRDRANRLRSLSSLLNCADETVATMVTALLDERRKLERELAEAKKALALGGGGAAGAAPAADAEIGGTKFSGQVIDGLDAKELRGLLDQAKARMVSGVAAIVAVNDGRASFAVAVTDDLTPRISAVDLVRAGVEALGGKGGGGRPDMAQGGGPDGAKAADAITAVRAVLAG